MFAQEWLWQLHSQTQPSVSVHSLDPVLSQCNALSKLWVKRGCRYKTGKRLQPLWTVTITSSLRLQSPRRWSDKTWPEQSSCCRAAGEADIGVMRHSPIGMMCVYCLFCHLTLCSVLLLRRFLCRSHWRFAWSLSSFKETSHDSESLYGQYKVGNIK